MLCGLQNIGNTCFMNAVLQTLAHCDKFHKYFMNLEFKTPLINNVISNLQASDVSKIEHELAMTATCQMYRLLYEMNKNKIVSPRKLKEILGMKNKLYAGFSQNDSHELLNFILDTIHEETKCTVEICTDSFPPIYQQVDKFKKLCIHGINTSETIADKKVYIDIYRDFEKTHQRELNVYEGIKFWANYIEHNFSVVSHFFTGVFHSKITCEHCNNVSRIFEIFTTLSVEIPNETEPITLCDCLKLFTTNSAISDYKCERCDNTKTCSKRMTLWNIPNIIFIHFKRFKTQKISETQSRIQKNSTMIDYPTQIDFADYMCKYNRKQQVYNLISVIHHYGSYSGGHYTSYNNVNDQWYCFDDAGVSEVSDIKKQVITDASYILAYKLQT